MSKIELVVKELKSISYEVIRPLLDKKLLERQSVDAAAGIVIDKLEVDPVRSEAGQDYNFYAARVLTSSSENPNFVNPHYHLKGEEPYYILAGDGGEMNLGVVKDGKVEWRDPQEVKVGDVIEVQEGEVHSLRNNGRDPLDFIFACPKEHLMDGEYGDRYFTKDLPNGVPPWYILKK